MCICGLYFHLNCSLKSIPEKKHKNVSLWSLSFVCRTWNICQSAPIPRNFPCPEKFLVAWLDNNNSKANKTFITKPFHPELGLRRWKFLKNVVLIHFFWDTSPTMPILMDIFLIWITIINFWAVWKDVFELVLLALLNNRKIILAFKRILKNP